MLFCGREADIQLPTGGKLKADQFAEAGISTNAAQHYEEFAAPREHSRPGARDHLAASKGL